MSEKHEITQLLRAFHAGDRSAFDRLFEIVYDDLHRRAHFQLRESSGGSLATTGLVHEAYLKLVGAHTVAGGQVSIRTRCIAPG
jgi:DNA-directed RNA polymerase specialized sigma24 family protein